MKKIIVISLLMLVGGSCMHRIMSSSQRFVAGWQMIKKGVSERALRLVFDPLYRKVVTAPVGPYILWRSMGQKDETDSLRKPTFSEYRGWFNNVPQLPFNSSSFSLTDQYPSVFERMQEEMYH